jgi:starch synthase
LQQALARNALPAGARLHLIQAGWFANDAIERAFRDGAAAHCPDVVCHFLDGRQADVRSGIWQAADIYTSLSDNLQETFGLSPIEGMAAGLPAVVSDWDGYRDTVRDGIDGFRVPTLMPPAPYGMELADRYDLEIDDYDHYIGFSSQLIAVDTGAAAAAYAALIGDPELRRRMGAAAAAQARAVFDWGSSWRRPRNCGPISPTGGGSCERWRPCPIANQPPSRWRICRAPIRFSSSPATRARCCSRIALCR